MDKWQGKVALVTGASAGIGRQVVCKLVENNMKVVGCARNFDKLEEIAVEVNQMGPGKMFPYQCDLTDESQILGMFNYIKKLFGTIHVCINNAAMARYASLTSGKTEDWREMVDTNIIALCICTRESLSLMRQGGVDDGHIINISSISGHKVTTRPFYCATKFAVKALTEGLRQEMNQQHSNIRSTSISPGVVETEFLHRMCPNNEARAKEVYKSMACLQPDDVANTVIFAMSAPRHVEINDLLVRPIHQPH